MSASLSELKLHMALDAFAWIPLSDWNVDRLIAYYRVNGKRQCKVCDAWLENKEEEKHIKDHVKYEKERRAAKKEAAAEARLEAAAEARKEKKLAKENYEAVLGNKDEDKPKVEKPKRKPRTVNTNRVTSFTLPDGEFTINQIVEESGVARNDVYKDIVRRVASGELCQVGTVKSGGRGRPAAIYARNKS
jgi:hypothetical protein